MKAKRANWKLVFSAQRGAVLFLDDALAQDVADAMKLAYIGEDPNGMTSYSVDLLQAREFLGRYEAARPLPGELDKFDGFVGRAKAWREEPRPTDDGEGEVMDSNFLRMVRRAVAAAVAAEMAKAFGREGAPAKAAEEPPAAPKAEAETRPTVHVRRRRR